MDGAEPILSNQPLERPPPRSGAAQRHDSYASNWLIVLYESKSKRCLKSIVYQRLWQRLIGLPDCQRMGDFPQHPNSGISY